MVGVLQAGVAQCSQSVGLAGMAAYEALCVQAQGRSTVALLEGFDGQTVVPGAVDGIAPGEQHLALVGVEFEAQRALDQGAVVRGLHANR
jgi:hypothetical protein